MQLLPIVKSQFSLLSLSERTIVRLVGHGNSTKDIADLLSLSSRTIEKHRANIIAKLNLPKEKNSLAIWAKENIEFLI